MLNALDPKPNGQSRSNIAKQIRQEAAAVSHELLKTPVTQVSNGETLSSFPPIATFTKCLPHDGRGFVDAKAYTKLLAELSQGSSNTKFALFPGVYTSGKPAAFAITMFSGNYINPQPGEALKPRTLELPLAGHIYDLQGPDVNAVAMPPAPDFGSDELVAEMAEIYAMALLRDVPFNEFEGAGGTTAGAGGRTVKKAVTALNALPWFVGPAEGAGPGNALTARENRRRRARHLDTNDAVNAQMVFRGSTPGAQKGPYLSQFMLIGSHQRGAPAGTGGPEEGMIHYGQQLVSQKQRSFVEGEDYLQRWVDWLDAQNGLRTHGRVHYKNDARFIHTPRDLATFVRYDALYQAYLNACLILMAQNCPMDFGLPEGPGHPTRDAVATFGGPHILSLLTEVASRVLKAVRRQKFLVHLRGRPGAIGGALTVASSAARPQTFPDETDAPKNVNWYAAADRMIAELGKASDIAAAIAAHNAGLLNDVPAGANVAGYDFGWQAGADNWLLPMAFPEGSPAHGSYGAGHATVAGACTTVLKAYFEMFAIGAPHPNDIDDWNPGAIYRGGDLSLPQMIDKSRDYLFPREIKLTEVGDPATKLTGTYRTSPDGSALVAGPDEGLTIQGELDKLAANIAIGRDFAGVHYYTDYYESLRLGERMAVGILQEQMLTYREPLSMRFTSFDGDHIMIAGTGGTYHGPQSGGYDPDDALILVWPAKV